MTILARTATRRLPRAERPAGFSHRTSPGVKQTPAGEAAEPSGARRRERGERKVQRRSRDHVAVALLPCPVWFSLARKTRPAELARRRPRFYLEL